MSMKKKKEVVLVISLGIVIVISLLGISYITFQTNLLKPHINSKTLKYISFYNQEKTDSIIIKNIEKIKNSQGRTNKNKSSLSLNITGKKGERYEIILDNKISKEYTKYINTFIEHNGKKIESNLDKLKTSQDGGKIIYQGKIDNRDVILRMWISKKSSKKIKDNFFEIKIKSGWEQ